ncbi:MAG: hypothetical protein ACKOKF_04440 [Bacteroidota bacterium]
MAIIQYLGNDTPAANTPAVLVQPDADYDYFVSVMCVNKGLGDAKITVYSKSLEDNEQQTLYAAYEMVLPGKTTWESKKWSLYGDHALYVKSDNGNVAFTATGILSEKVVI